MFDCAPENAMESYFSHLLSTYIIKKKMKILDK